MPIKDTAKPMCATIIPRYPRDVLLRRRHMSAPWTNMIQTPRATATAAPTLKAPPSASGSAKPVQTAAAHIQPAFFSSASGVRFHRATGASPRKHARTHMSGTNPLLK